ncbi:PREDICTED: protein GAMETE EXPRESSED 1-like [Nelumbo nucifera]|uniref:Protein GAMETE EXPRESSED 1-like n=1 Tax=Nelumbo nucifera TaxID=4432 RepID=A0A1U7Z8E3_NELNU|nr:PREDICTED: protein GAMETE EXPRESSED 1-like [Nelumbo nucifera]
MIHHISHFLVFLVLVSLSPHCQSWGWFSSSTTTTHQNNYPSKIVSASEFSMEILNDRKGIKLIENARSKLVSTNSCWQNAYRNLFAGCSEIIADKEKQSRLAWHLSDCFQKDSGRLPFPSCGTGTPMVKCLKNLDEFTHKIYLEFFLETNSICHQLQADAFKQETERLVNDLKRSAEVAEGKLEIIEDISEQLLQNSNQIHDSLTSIDTKTQQVVQKSKDVEGQIDAVLNHSIAIFEQSKGIAASQSELQEGQEKMKDILEGGMAMLHESYQSLGQEVEKLRSETVEIEREINKVGDSMSLKMKNLQDKADDIGDIAGLSLDKQKQLLDGQFVALEGLDFLTKFQSQALEESRATLQKLAEFGQKQQEELLQRQEQLQQAHDHLVENSRSILEAQEAFELKQASMFMALEKLFMLHNAILLESRSIKTFFFYSFAIFIFYMLTSAKQTYCVRPRIYLGLCVTFLVELVVVRLGADDLDQQTWIASKILMARSLFLMVASFQILYSIFTYRDYEVLNHQLLLKLMEKINNIERNKLFSLEDTESDVNLSSWVDTELPEDVDNCEDPDYIFPEEVGENSVMTTSITRKNLQFWNFKDSYFVNWLLDCVSWECFKWGKPGHFPRECPSGDGVRSRSCRACGYAARISRRVVTCVLTDAEYNVLVRWGPMLSDV